jgi:hypothetical protein
MNYAPDLQALFLYLNTLKQTKSSLYMSRHFSLDSVLAQDLFDSFLWNCDFSPFSFLRVSSALHKVITVHIYTSYIMLYVLAGLCCFNCVLLYVPCTLYKKPRCIREYNCFSLFINIKFQVMKRCETPSYLQCTQE